MAPIWLEGLVSSSATQLFGRQVNTASSNSTSASGFQATQWQNPQDILSILLLLGPDVVQRAIAQLAGRGITPVAFSFGWVAYAVGALLSSFGDGRLMPGSETTLTVIDTNSGHGRDTRNWVLGRLLRDFNNRLDEEMKDEQLHISSEANDNEKLVPADSGKGEGKGGGKPFEGLRVTMFEVEDEPPTPHGVPTLDWVWCSGFAVIVVQLGIAAVPWGINGQWNTFLVTAAGNLLALIGGSLPQWRKEKWACPKKGGDTTTITEGNGSRSAIVILRKKHVGLKFEVLARGTRVAPATLLTRIATPVLAAFWILLLITVAGMKQGTCFQLLTLDTPDLLSIGLLGSIQNLIAAGVRRSPAALGIHIKEVETIRARYVAETLKKVEEKYPLVGTSLLNVFFPGSMRVSEQKQEEIAFWRAALDARYKENKHGIRLDCLPPAL
ncbi:hypothetical protein GP486_000020 [Trichoglossum hirsutum]|uniref:Uncharacterized protein n=1 Tax=Trichoglossum hirsutum TaxID=265104 RepID=A0A9P8LIK5_9PEZI|nr:hypothetical protein GP486_000020 [Trichoglossum hirsutum]